MSFAMIMWDQNMKKKTYVNMITDIFIVYTNAEDIYIDIAKDVKTKFETSN